MATETATSSLNALRVDPNETGTILYGGVRVVVTITWYLLVAAWIAYMLGFLPFATLRAQTLYCAPFLTSAVETGTDSQFPCVVGAVVIEYFGWVIYFGAAVLLFLRKPDDLMTFMASATLLILCAGISSITLGLANYPALVGISRLVLGAGLWVAVVFFLLFPAGLFRPRWTVWVAVAHGAWVLSWWFIPALDMMPRLSLFTYPILMGSTLPAIFLVIRGYRHFFTPTQRQQTKWVIFSLLTMVVIFMLGGVLALFANATLRATSEGAFVSVLGVWGRWGALTLIPIGICFSVARYRLWDVDLVINRAVVVGAVTGVLGAVFIAVILVVQQIAITFTGAEQSSLAVALASLAVAILFAPLRQRLTAGIDRRFYPTSVPPLALPTRFGSETQPQLMGIRDHVAGSVFGVYEIESLIGRGGMAEVYRGRHTGLDRPVAIKILTPALSSDERFRARFTREGQTVAHLSHPNIVTVYDAGQTNDTYYIAMEYIDGETLSVFLKREGVLTLNKALPILIAVASALDYAHDHGIIHRDIKPQNIMLQHLDRPNGGTDNKLSDNMLSDNTLSYRPVLMDFGIARLVEARTALTTGSGALGTLDYIAPEQILESSRVDRRADIYSLGVVTYLMMTGKLPFVEDNAGAVIMAHLQKPAPDPRRLNPQLPLRASLAILRSMQKDPEERQQTAGEFVAALQAAAHA